MKEQKAIDLIESQSSIEVPWHTSRFFQNFRNIDFANDQASLGEDFGTLQELRDDVEWVVDQLGGSVKWTKRK